MSSYSPESLAKYYIGGQFNLTSIKDYIMNNKVMVGVVVLIIIIGIIIWSMMRKPKEEKEEEKSEKFTGPTFHDSKAMFHLQPDEYKGLGDNVEWGKVQEKIFSKKKAMNPSILSQQMLV